MDIWSARLKSIWIGKDLGKNITGNIIYWYNRVTLEIVEAILDTCRENVKVVSCPGLRIVGWVIGSGQEALVVRGAATVRIGVFCFE